MSSGTAPAKSPACTLAATAAAIALVSSPGVTPQVYGRPDTVFINDKRFAAVGIGVEWQSQNRPLHLPGFTRALTGHIGSLFRSVQCRFVRAMSFAFEGRKMAQRPTTPRGTSGNRGPKSGPG